MKKMLLLALCSLVIASSSVSIVEAAKKELKREFIEIDGDEVPAKKSRTAPKVKVEEEKSPKLPAIAEIQKTYRECFTTSEAAQTKHGLLAIIGTIKHATAMLTDESTKTIAAAWLTDFCKMTYEEKISRKIAHVISLQYLHKLIEYLSGDGRALFHECIKKVLPHLISSSPNLDAIYQYVDKMIVEINNLFGHAIDATKELPLPFDFQSILPKQQSIPALNSFMRQPSVLITELISQSAPEPAPSQEKESSTNSRFFSGFGNFFTGAAIKIATSSSIGASLAGAFASRTDIVASKICDKIIEKLKTIALQATALVQKQQQQADTPITPKEYLGLSFESIIEMLFTQFLPQKIVETLPEHQRITSALGVLYPSAPKATITDLIIKIWQKTPAPTAQAIATLQKTLSLLEGAVKAL